MVTIKIDDIEVQVPEDTPILKAAEKAGIWIPTMCYNDLIEPYGVCRLCSVEVIRGKRSRVVTSCNYPVREGISVRTNSEKIKWIRKVIMELMVSRWPNVKVVREMAEKLGIEKPRFESLEKDEAPDACILCGLCVNVCRDLVGASILGFAYRGIKREVVLPFDEITDKCIVCGACAHVCPTGHVKMIVEDYKGKKPEFTLGPKTAIYVPSMQAVPRVPVIDPESCIHFKTGGCETCAKVCEPKAINYEMKDEVVEIDVGQILVATGYDLFDASQMAQYGYGRYDNVYSSLEFEMMLNSTGPTGGKVLTKDGKEPRAVGIIHCIGSRDTNYHPYCSRVCCMYALKFAHLVHDRTNAAIYQFYIDMRAFGKGYEEFYSRLLDEGINMIRGKAAEVVEAPPVNGQQGNLLIRCEDTLIGKFREIPVDMVILCNAIEPKRDSDIIRRLFSISKSPDGFFLERHPKLDPTATTTDGVYIAGCAQGPKDIPDTVAQASSAAARILTLISRGEVEIDPVRAMVMDEYCSGCRICNNLCPYGAIEFLEDKKISHVNEALCKGCGTCVAACPSSAMTGQGFTDAQILSELEGLLI
ncbi:MAG: CoB--CoM heterodisulfide reductase subunit A [Ignavibacteriae bacterium]|nr:MAG: CoB--CoM heterodisulfide reductase subunit A [Ignavibacteriota bacterium]